MQKQLRFLILEDLPTDAELVVDELKKSALNFKFKIVANEADFQTQLKTFKPDLVLSDYSLPTFTGMEALQIVTEKYPHIPIIIVTGSINEETAVACMKAGASDYVLKEKLKRLVPAVEAALKNTQLLQEKAKIEAQLKSTEERLRLSFNNAAIGMVQISPEGKFITVNKAFEEMIGYTELELQTKTFQDITHPEDYEIGSEIVKQILHDERKSGSLEKRYLRKDGQTIWVHLSTSLIRDEEGKPLHFFTQAEDITARKQAQKDLQQAHEETRKTQDIFRKAIENATGVPYLLNIETGGYEFAGDGIEKLLGVKLDELNRSKMKRIVQEVLLTDPAYGDTIQAESSTELFKAKKLDRYKADFKIKLASGEEKWISDSAIPMLDEQGQVTHSLGILLDITDRKNAELELARKERYYRALLNQLHEDVIVIDRDYQITDMNNSFLITTGKERTDVIGKHCFYVSHGYNQPCDLEGENCELKKVFKTGRPSNCLHEHIQVDGSKEWVDILLSPLKDENDRVTHVIESARNISELISVQEDLRKLSTAIEQSPVSVVITNLDGSIEYVNPKFCTVTGYTKEEALGQNPRVLKSGEQDDRFYKSLWETISKGETWQGEFHNRKKDGELFWEDATIGPILDADGNISHYIALKEDITAQKKLEEQLQQSQKLEAVGQLAGGVAHDFNNLLTVINGYSDLIMTKLDETDDLYKDIMQIAKAGERAGGLTQQLLAFSRKQIIQPKIIHLNSLISETEKMLRRLIGEDIELTCKFGQNLDLIKADPGQLDQVLLNLCVNARDAMPQGGQLIIETDNLEINGDFYKNVVAAKPGKYVSISITDTGKGMDDKTKKRIFEPFFTTKEKGRGTGLGLATVYGIVKQNKGYIWVYSELDVGTTFKIYLPALSEDVESGKDYEVAEQDYFGSETIMVVEDEEDVRELTSEILLRAGYHILQAADGSEALRAVTENPDKIQLLLADVIMPKMGGKKLMEELKKTAPGLKVIFVSGYTDDAISRSGVLDKGVIFLQKPYAPKTLLKLVRNTLDGSPSR